MKALRFLLAACFLGAVVYLHVWQRVQILKHGYEIARLEDEMEELMKERRLLRLEHGRASSLNRVSVASPEFGGRAFEGAGFVEVVFPQDGGGPVKKE